MSLQMKKHNAQELSNNSNDETMQKMKQNKKDFKHNWDSHSLKKEKVKCERETGLKQRYVNLKTNQLEILKMKKHLWNFSIKHWKDKH